MVHIKKILKEKKKKKRSNILEEVGGAVEPLPHRVIGSLPESDREAGCSLRDRFSASPRHPLKSIFS